MADIDPRQEKLDRLVKLFEELRTNQAKVYAITEEIRAVFAEDESPAKAAKRAIVSFTALWEEQYRSKYVVTWSKHMVQTKRVLRVMSVEEFEVRIRLYLANRERFVTNATHSLDLFLATVNNYVPEAGLVSQPVIGCTHTPRCTSDTEHTTRRLRDLRASSEGPKA